MVFAVLTVLSLLGLAFRQTALRFRAAEAAAGGAAAGKFSWPGYGKWLRRRGAAVLKDHVPAKTMAWFNTWTGSRYPGRLKWVFAAFLLSFLGLAASGFFFAVFIPRGMYGWPLVGHVGLGGLYAAGLAFILVWRTRDYRFDRDEEAAFEAFACPMIKNVSKAFVRKILYWGFALFGLLIILTALLSMLPVLPAEAQKTLAGIHKYSALASILLAGLFADITFIPEPRP